MSPDPDPDRFTVFLLMILSAYLLVLINWPH
jgi:hypothetical protein